NVANRNLTAVEEISRKVSTILDPDRLTGETLKLTGSIVDFVWGVMWIKNPRSGKLEARHCMNSSGADRTAPAELPAAVAMVARTSRSAESSGFFPEKLDAFDESASLSVLAVPLCSRGEIMGVLGLATAAPKGYTSRERRLLETLAENVAIAIHNAQLFKQREREAIRDGLTRLYNHRYLQEQLTQEEGRARRYSRLFSLIILDIDHFKIYNDAFGHPAGDKLLVDVAKLLRDSVRQVDFVARYGGEEFAVVLPECDRDGAVLVAERVRKSVEEFPNPHQEDYNLTISAGVASFPTDGENKEEVINRADEALYRAKREGRNRVCW
ncbi:diguanylate cyclase, partial [bacterium]|nr:diguanylate cyclase [bacterium]